MAVQLHIKKWLAAFIADFNARLTAFQFSFKIISYSTSQLWCSTTCDYWRMTFITKKCMAVTTRMLVTIPFLSQLNLPLSVLSMDSTTQTASTLTNKLHLPKRM